MGICFSEVVESKFLPKDLNPKLLPEFVPPIKSGRVIKVYDGDTITIASKIPKLKNSQIYKFHVRLNGIDTPEIKTHDEDEKNIAIKARDALSDKILNKDVILKNVKIEKYGRLLCDIYYNNINLNEWLITNRYAVKYDGGTKISPTSWTKYHENNSIV